MPRSREKREALALEIGADGFRLLDALDVPTAPLAAHAVAMVQTMRQVWQIHYARDEGQLVLAARSANCPRVPLAAVPLALST